MFKTTAALLTCALLTAAPLDELHSTSVKDQKISRSFSVSTEMEMDSLSVMVDGEDMREDMDDFEHKSSISLLLEVTDVIQGVKDGEVQKLARTFDTLEMVTGNDMSGPMGDQSDEMDFTSELEGVTVEFERGEDGFEAAYPEGEDGDSDLLEGLDALLSFSDVLPGKEIAEGDTWEIPLELYSMLSEPGGNLHFEPETENENMSDMGSMAAEQVDDDPDPELDGKIEATYKGTREVDDVKYAVIAIAVEVSAVTDRTEFFNSMKGDAPDGGEFMMPTVNSATEEAAFEGEGEILWNIEAGHMHTLKLEGDAERIEMMELEMSMGDMEQTMEQTSTMVGTESYSVSFGA